MKHTGCIAHSLHLIVGPLFQHAGGSQAVTEFDDVVVDDFADYDAAELMEVIASHSNSFQDTVSRVSNLVGNFRKVIKYIRKSVIATEKFHSIQQAQSPGLPLTLDLDVRTRWNSTFTMIEKLMRLRTSITIFLQYLKSPEGKREFNRVSLPDFRDEEWALMDGVLILLHPFASITTKLCSEKYPTFIFAMPFLRRIKMLYLENDNLFVDNTDSNTLVKSFFSKYRDEPYIASVIEKLTTIQRGILDQFKKRFHGLTIDILWTTVLDPRCRSLKHLTAYEQSVAKEVLITETAKVLKAEYLEQKKKAARSAAVPNNPNIVSLEDDLDVLDSPMNGRKSSFDDDDSLKATARREVDAYLGIPAVNPQTNSLTWWRDHKQQFPRLAFLARKWLGVTATTTPSERVFSDCGLVLTSKRNRLHGDIVKAQIMIKRNIRQVPILDSDIKLMWQAKNQATVLI